MKMVRSARDSKSLLNIKSFAQNFNCFYIELYREDLFHPRNHFHLFGSVISLPSFHAGYKGIGGIDNNIPNPQPLPGWREAPPKWNYPHPHLSRADAKSNNVCVFSMFEEIRQCSLENKKNLCYIYIVYAFFRYRIRIVFSQDSKKETSMEPGSKHDFEEP